MAVSAEKRGNFGFDIAEQEERFLMDIVAKISERLKTKYSYTNEEIFKAFDDNEIFIPIHIFSGSVGPAEAVTKYLHGNLGLDYGKIAELIGRDVKTVWSNYQRAVKKMPWAFEQKESIAVPASIFNSELSLLESLIAYLKDVKKMSNAKIAKLLNKDSRNVWSLYDRACDKRKKDDNNK